jgi:hypothetical protein
VCAGPSPAARTSLPGPQSADVVDNSAIGQLGQKLRDRKPARVWRRVPAAGELVDQDRTGPALGQLDLGVRPGRFGRQRQLTMPQQGRDRSWHDHDRVGWGILVA